MVAAFALMSFALVNFITPGVRLAELHQHLLRILQQGALKEAPPEVLFEAPDDDDVLSIQRVGGLIPLTLLLHCKAGEHSPHRRDLCLPPLSIRPFPPSTTLHNQSLDSRCDETSAPFELERGLAQLNW